MRGIVRLGPETRRGFFRRRALLSAVGPPSTGVRRRLLVPVPSQPDHEAMVDERRCVRSCVVSGDTVGVQRPHADVRPLGTAGQPLERGHVDRAEAIVSLLALALFPLTTALRARKPRSVKHYTPAAGCVTADCGRLSLEWRALRVPSSSTVPYATTSDGPALGEPGATRRTPRTPSAPGWKPGRGRRGGGDGSPVSRPFPPHRPRAVRVAEVTRPTVSR